jgi:Flp pilus assembly protein TadD
VKIFLLLALVCCSSLAFASEEAETAARARLEKILEKEPANVPALIGLGELEYRAKHLEEAEQVLRRATLAQPQSAPAWLALGVVTCDAGKLDAALAALSQAVWLDPKNARAHNYLGVTVGRKGWRDGAEAELQRALELDESLADAHFNLAVVYLQENPPLVELARRHYYRARDLGAAPDSLVEKQINGSKE